MKRLLIFIVVVCLCALIFSPAPVPVQGQGGIDTSKWYQLIAKHSGKCLDNRYGNLVDGELLMQNTCHSGDNQKFQFESVGSGYYRIKTGHSHRCIDQIGANSTPGGSIGQYQCHTGYNQQWMPSTSGGYYAFNVRHSGMNLDVLGGSTANFALLVQYYAYGTDNQLFTLYETTPPCTDSGDADADGWCAPWDCDDNDPDTYPGAPNNCESGVDRDCNGSDDYEECYGPPCCE